MTGPLLRAAAGAAALLLLAAAWAAAVPSRAQDAAPPPARHRVGLYVTDLHGFDPARGTFGAGFWVWAVGPGSARALRSMEFANADRLVVDLESTAPRGAAGSWSQRKATGTFRHDWDLRNFPFDRHELEILLEEGALEEGGLTYDADAANSGHGLRGPVEGWRVTRMRVEAVTAAYATSFGDPAAPGPESRFARIRAVLTLERASRTGFLKLTATLYAGFLVCAVGTLMHVTALTFAPRVTLLVASLFSLVVGMQTASAALGGEHGATLVDGLHVAGLAYVVAVAAVTVLVRTRTGEQGPTAPDLVRLDRRCCLAAAAAFAANALLLAGAAVRG